MDGCNPLMLSLKYSNPSISDFILNSKDISINQTCRYGSALHIAILKQCFDMVVKILDFHNDIDVNLKDVNGNTALHAIFRDFDSNKSQSEKITGMLIEKNAIIGEENKFGLTPLMYAAKKGQLCALEYASKYNKRHLKGTVFRFDVLNSKCKWTLLHYAARSNKINVIKHLISVGVNPLKIDSSGKRASDIAFAYTHISKLLKAKEKEYVKAVFNGYPSKINKLTHHHLHNFKLSTGLCSKSKRHIAFPKYDLFSIIKETGSKKDINTTSYLLSPGNTVNDDFNIKQNYNSQIEQIGLRPFLEQNLVMKGKNKEMVQQIQNEEVPEFMKYKFLYNMFQKCDELTLRTILKGMQLDPIVNIDAIFLIGFFPSIHNYKAIHEIIKCKASLSIRVESHNCLYYVKYSIFKYYQSSLNEAAIPENAESILNKTQDHVQSMIKEIRVRDVKQYFNNCK
jgi:ankyrin repeat protein